MPCAEGKASEGATCQARHLPPLPPLAPSSPLQGIQVLPLPEAQAALRTQLGITVLSDFMSLLTDEDQSCMFYLAEKYGALHEWGTGLVLTEHLMLVACERMLPAEATFVRERLGYIRACHQDRAPDCEFRCFTAVLRNAGGRGMQVGTHGAAVWWLCGLHCLAGWQRCCCRWGKFEEGGLNGGCTGGPRCAYKSMDACARHVNCSQRQYCLAQPSPPPFPLAPLRAALGRRRTCCSAHTAPPYP